MNKCGLVNHIAGRSTLTKSQVKHVVDEVFDVISETLSREEKFKVAGFGTFDVVHRPARNGTNPRTGEKIRIPGRSAPVFLPGKKLRNIVNNKSAS